MKSKTILLSIFLLIKRLKRSANVFIRQKIRHKIIKMYALYFLIIKVRGKLLIKKNGNIESDQYLLLNDV